MRLPFRVVLSFALAIACSTLAIAQPAAVEYTLSFPAPEQRWMQVDVRFPARAGTALEVRMARSSPGRYATHEFGKNVHRVEALHADGTPLPLHTIAPAHWRIVPRGAVVHLRYRLFADHVDGTYAAVDGTHAHLNAPAALAWAPSLPEVPIRVTFVQPEGRRWQVATQLFPTADPLVFTAPNLQYLMDSPMEFSAHATREFMVERPSGAAQRVRLAVHHLGTDAELDGFARQVEAIVREQAAVFGEVPAFDGGTYTFLMDYLPWADGDGMEHRNSTVCSSSGALADGSVRMASTAAHEFFHAWNVERIRPASLEPFDFTRANMSGDLWLAEGVTSYYGSLTLMRTGLVAQDSGVAQLAGYVNTALLSPGTQFRSAVEMSQLAPYVDAAVQVDETNWENTYASYYPFGAAIGLGLDLTLRERSEGRVSLDDLMRALWKAHGVPGGKAPGYVARPYTLADVERALASVSGDAAFASQFITRHVTGTEPIPFARLLAAVGYDVRPIGGPFLGPVNLQSRRGAVVVGNTTIATSPIYKAGVGKGDAIVSLAGTPIAQPSDWSTALKDLKVGDVVELVFESRGERKTARVTVEADPRLTITPMQARSAAQQALREGWLKSRR